VREVQRRKGQRAEGSSRVVVVKEAAVSGEVRKASSKCGNTVVEVTVVCGGRCSSAGA